MLNQVDRILLYYPTTELMENLKTKLHDRSFVKYRPAVKLRQHSNYVIRIITICCVWQTIQSHSLIFRVVVPWTSPKKPKLHNSQSEVWNKYIYIYIKSKHDYRELFIEIHSTYLLSPLNWLKMLNRKLKKKKTVQKHIINSSIFFFFFSFLPEWLNFSSMYI